jgi:hypothetical protein
VLYGAFGLPGLCGLLRKVIQKWMTRLLTFTAVAGTCTSNAAWVAGPSRIYFVDYGDNLRGFAMIACGSLFSLLYCGCNFLLTINSILKLFGI